VLLEALEDLHASRRREGSVDLDLLEAPGERAVALEGWPRYSVEGRRPDAAQRRTRAAGLSMFDASIEPPLAAPAPTMVWISSMKRIRVGLLLERLEHRLEPLLEVAAVARARDERAHVEGVDLRP
jgi:hypothetical protein